MQHDRCELQSVHLSIWKLLNSSVCLCETSKYYAVRSCTWLSLCPCNSWQNVWKDLSAKNETGMSTGLEFRLLRILKQWLDPYILCMSGAEITTAISVTTNPSLLECECHRSSTACISWSFWFIGSQNLSYFGILPLLTRKSLNMPASMCLIIFCHLSSHCLDWELSEAQKSPVNSR